MFKDTYTCTALICYAGTRMPTMEWNDNEKNHFKAYFPYK